MKSESGWAWPVIAAAPVVVLTLQQGGYFGQQSCACGVAVCLLAAVAWLGRPLRRHPLPRATAALLALAFLYLLSALASGATLTTLSEVGAWAAVAGMSALSASADEELQGRAVWLLAWFGVVTAALGLMVYVGVFAVRDGVADGRLQFTFQYANAAAAWYGAMGLLCLLAPDRRLRGATLLPATALLLTASGGGLLAFAAFALFLGARWAFGGEWGRLLAALAQGVIAVSAFACLRVTHGAASLAVVALVLGAALAGSRLQGRIAGCGRARRLSLLLAGLLIAFAALVALTLSSRVTGALATFAERLCQVRDGLSLWSGSPLLGVGPDRWQFLFQGIQSAQYYASVVHCSYVQMMLDAGVLALLAFVAACALGVGALWRRLDGDGWACGRLAAASFVLVHSLVDFDLQFCALAMLVALLLAESRDDGARYGRGGVVVGLACLLLCTPLCAVGFLCSSSLSAMKGANARGDYGRCEWLVRGDALAVSDVAAQEQYVVALFGQGRYAEVARVYGELGLQTDLEAVLAARSLYAIGDGAAAGLVQVERMEALPYDYRFFWSSKEMVDTYGLDASLAGRYNDAVERANRMAREACGPYLTAQEVEGYSEPTGL